MSDERSEGGGPEFGQSRYQLGPDDRPTVPSLFTQESVPADFYQPAEPLGTAQPADIPERRDRRRGAFLAVGLVALATVVVVAAALIIGPHLGSGKGDDNQQAAPPVTPHSTSAATSTAAPTSTAADIAPPPTPMPVTPIPTGTEPSVRTVTVTAGQSGSAAGETTRAATSTTTASSATSTSTSAVGRYEVPTVQIACSDGYIVQLASELTASAFARRVQDLKSKGMVPADAKAADSTKSCKLFTNQTNTFILYSGPFSRPYDACTDRLAGPYDAFIRGANPGTSADFVSCICPAKAHDLPRIHAGSAPSQWTGELQRMLAAHLRYSIPDLGVGKWGTYTGDTRGAVKRFQSDHHLKPTGTVDGKTWSALQHAGC